MTDARIGIGILGTAAIARKNIRAIKLARNNLGGCLNACRCPLIALSPLAPVCKLPVSQVEEVALMSNGRAEFALLCMQTLLPLAADRKRRQKLT